MREHPRVGALSPRLIGVDGVPQQCLYPFPSLARLLRTAIGQQSPTPEEDVADGWLAGTALFLRREALGQIGGELDAGYFMYWEDADVCARLRQARVATGSLQRRPRPPPWGLQQRRSGLAGPGRLARLGFLWPAPLVCPAPTGP